jgi:hypothetical protein
MQLDSICTSKRTETPKYWLNHQYCQPQKYSESCCGGKSRCPANELPVRGRPAHMLRYELHPHTTTHISTMSNAQRLEVPTTAKTVSEKPWHAYITIDLLALVLARSVFHPYIAWLVPLCLRSLSYSYSHPHFKYACVYATCVTVFALLHMLDKRLAWGPPRKLNWDEEVVVITGGAGGLGKVLAETYGMRGVSVAVLDIREPEEQNEALENVRFYKCDISSIADVQKARISVEKDVRNRYHNFSIKPHARLIHVVTNIHSSSSALVQSSSTTPAPSQAPLSSP